MRDFLSQRSPNPTTSHLLSPTPSSSFEVKASPFSVGIRQVRKGMKGKRGTWEITGMGGMGKKLMENQRRAVLSRDLREVEAADLIHNFLKTKKSFTNQGILRKKLLRGCSSHMSILQFFCLPWPTKIMHTIIEINLKELWSQQEKRGAIKDQRNRVIPVAGVPICYS